ncbi:Hypothetical predicted protein [Mytilus galloprovincialis]|uniref:EGF-like domain-containing protein n=1 Tax=Mytilus galloprovincialis TaxID=29158 RepID=A0A8B6BP88_MYTGA|nr:Hypothetical predicted protein [Mytilus galloprovincialis]
MVKITNVTGGVYQKNRISNTHVIKASEMIGPKGCVKDCMMYADYNAVNFHKDRFYCELLDDSYSDHEAENKYGVYFTNISEWTKIIYIRQDNDACWPKTCPPKTRCIVAYRNERLCLPFDTPCDNNQCQNGASCINSVRDYSCRCLAGYYGQYCEQMQAPVVYLDQRILVLADMDIMERNASVVLAFQPRVTMVVYVLRLDPTHITARATLAIQEQLASKKKTPAMVAVELSVPIKLSVVRTIVNVMPTAPLISTAVLTQ